MTALHQELIKSISNSEPNWITKRRLDSFKKFKTLPPLNMRYGLSIYVHLLGFNIEDIHHREQASNLNVSKNNQIEILSIQEAFKKYKDLMEKHFGSLISEDEDKVTALHLALWNKGIFIRIPKNTEVKDTIEINTIMDTKRQFEYIFIIAEDNTKATFLENTASSVEEGYRSNVVELIVGNNSQIKYGNIQSISQGCYNFVINRAKVGKDSSLEWFSGTFGSKYTRLESTSILSGQGSSTKNLGAFFASKEQQFDIYTSSVHIAPNTTSDILVKGAAQDKAKSIYRGLIEIKENASNSNGYQKQDTLLLNEGIEADAIPKLLIGNNEVRCTHGATIGQIDKEKIFYLMTRGLSEKEAKQQIVSGFFSPILTKISNENIKSYIESIIEQRLK